MDATDAFVFSPPGAATVAASAADLSALVDRLGAAVLSQDLGDGNREPSALLAVEALLDAVRWLKEERGYGYLRSLTAVDFWQRGSPRFQVVYHLAAIPAGMLAGDPRPRPDEPTRLLRLKVGLPEENPVAPSLTGIFPTAGFHERETYDMFGIEFAGHPDLRRILMPEGYEGFPLRKDHPLQYEEIAFSFNQETVYASKPFAKE
ncbi:MAG: NADH-quinone oxidoreductase subunit C [Ardenticatenia bacterium]|nr:NADH-quinone oxidoreductase subunit C [Ardenticatenia bacterium]